MKLRLLALIQLLRNAGCVERPILDESETLARAGEYRVAFESLLSSIERDGIMLTDQLTAIMADVAAELGLSADQEAEAAQEPTSREYVAWFPDRDWSKGYIVVQDVSSPVAAAETVALDHWDCLPDGASIETLTINCMAEDKRVFRCVVEPKLTCSADVISCDECEVN